MISALCVREDSVYKQLGLDCWDVKRDVNKFPGGNAVIAHPPCRGWGRLRKFAKPIPGELEVAIRCIQKVRMYGGILEHPRSTGLIEKCSLPVKGEIDKFGGFCLSVNQSWFGHEAKKNTLLYIVGMEKKQVPAHNLNFNLVSKKVDQLSVKKREGTPGEFAEWLIEMAKIINKNRSYDEY